MKKEIKNIDVKSFVNEINTAVVAGTVIKDNKTELVEKKEKNPYGYQFLFVSGSDFALNRITPKTNRTLVSIYSQGLLFIYDEIKETKKVVTDLKQLNSFFSDKKADDYVIEAGKIPYAKRGIKKYNLEKWLNVLNDKSPGIKTLIKRGLIDFLLLSNNYHYMAMRNLIDKCYKNHPSLLISVFQNYLFNDSLSTYEGIITFANAIYEMSDLDTAKYFVKKSTESSMHFSYVYFPDLKPFNLNVRRLIDYILFDLYKQGIKTLNLLTYHDYLAQTMDYYGKIDNKYPKSLMTEHQKISRKIVAKAKIGVKSQEYVEIMSECEDFSYRNSIDNYRIIMPKEATDLVDEGEYLGHCVASYVDKVVNGDCIVVFMREKDAEDVPYLTVEILPDRTIPQVEGMHKRSELTEDEKEFINRWAKYKHLKVTAENAVIKNTMIKMKEIA